MMLAKIEKMIADRKRLRCIYEIIIEHGDLNTEYEGCFNRLGDTLMIRPRPDINKGLQPNRNLSIDTVLPRKNRMQFVLNRIDWEVEGDVIIVCDDNDFYMGYREITDEILR